MSKPPLPASRDGITASWMHRALVAGGLADCAPVEAVIFEDMDATEQGAVSDTFRAELRYREDGGRPGPETVIVKLPTLKRSVRRTSRMMSVYLVECEFYMRIAEHAPVATPGLLYGDFNPRDHGFVLLLADLRGLESVPFRDGASAEQAMTAIRAIARVHAAFWEQDGSAVLSRVPRFASLWRRVLIQLYYQAMLGRAVDGFGDILRGSMRRLAEAYGPRLADHFAADARSMPRTLVHGDYRTQNLFYGEAGSDEVTVIDWQLTSMHCGLYDVAFFVINSLTPEVRREVERPALEEYHRIVCAEGAADISFEACWRAYRSSILAILMPLVVGCGVVDIEDRTMAEGMDLLLRRLAVAIDDLDAAELLPAPRSPASPGRWFSMLSASSYRARRAVDRLRRR